MRVLVCGSRDYADTMHVFDTLDNLNRTRGPITCVIHGAGTGADTASMEWAQMEAEHNPYRKIVHHPFVADWHTYGRAAGPMRNQRMIDEGHPDLIVAFPGGAGTRDMVARAKAARLEVIEVPARRKRA